MQRGDRFLCLANAHSRMIPRQPLKVLLMRCVPALVWGVYKSKIVLFRGPEVMFKTSAADSEYVTRKLHIDKKLTYAGWKVVEFKSSIPLSEYERCAVEEYPTENGPPITL